MTKQYFTDEQNKKALIEFEIEKPYPVKFYIDIDGKDVYAEHYDRRGTFSEYKMELRFFNANSEILK